MTPDDLPYWLLTRANVWRMALVACGLFWTALITAAVEIFR